MDTLNKFEGIEFHKFSDVGKKYSRSTKTLNNLNERLIQNHTSIRLFLTCPIKLNKNPTWLPTMGKKPYLWFRFYAPEEEFWNKTFNLADLELVN
jgi:hypothetical protein